MSTYAIGDVQGCYDELLQLLNKINFNPQNDQLWFTGDLVNRGPKSLEVLRFVKQLGDSAITVLGNHDLHLLAVAFNNTSLRKKDTLEAVLCAPDSKQLLDWLRTLPLFHQDQGFALIHAGLPPQWDITQTEQMAEEVERTLVSDHICDYLHSMYGNEPRRWSEALSGNKRLRFITNALTRLRYCDQDGNFCLGEAGPPGTQPEPCLPWFMIETRKTAGEKIIFGHWSTIFLGNISDFRIYNVYPLDTGCTWGGKLTAMRLEDETMFQVESLQPKKFA